MDNKVDTEIKFDASVAKIVEFEKRSGASIIATFSGNNISMTTLVELIKVLSGVEDIAVIDAHIKKVGFEGLTTELEDALVAGGFLSKEKVNADRARKARLAKAEAQARA